MRLAQHVRVVGVLMIAIAATGASAAPVTRTEILDFGGFHHFGPAFGTSGLATQGAFSISYAVSADQAFAVGGVSDRLAVSFDSVVPLSAASATNIGLNFGGLPGAIYTFGTNVDARTIINSSFLTTNLSAEVLQNVSETTSSVTGPGLPAIFVADHSTPAAVPPQSAVNGTVQAESSYVIDSVARLTADVVTGSILAIHEGGTQRTFGVLIDAPAESMQLDLGLPGQWVLFFTNLQVETDLHLAYFFTLDSSVKVMVGGIVVDSFNLSVDQAPLYSFTGDLMLRQQGLGLRFSIFVDDGTNSAPAPGTLLLCLIALAGLAFNRGRRR